MENKNLNVLRNFKMSDITTRSEVDGKNIIEGHAAVFEKTTNIGGFFYEVIERGAFDNCDLSDVALFVNHDDNEIPLARSKNGIHSTMQLNIDEVGLFIRAELDIENNQNAAALYSAIARRDIDGMSFAFLIDEESWENLDTPMPTRRIKKISKVFEVSAVNNPAYDDTEIYARDKKTIEDVKEEIKNARSDDFELEKEKLLLKLKLMEE